MGSEIVRFRKQQTQAEQAATLGLSGYAITSPHAMIEKRMEQGAVHLQHLMDAGRYDEAFALMETDDWQGIPPNPATPPQAVPDEQKGKPDERDVTSDPTHNLDPYG
jgi:hypothetical protein